jgi:hypothetical protein
MNINNIALDRRGFKTYITQILPCDRQRFNTHLVDLQRPILLYGGIICFCAALCSWTKFAWDMQFRECDAMDPILWHAAF